jgi:putative endonuclease
MGHRHLDLGRRGEALAAEVYEARGYEVLARNWRDGRAGELDLVVTKRRTLVVCEVKTRSSVAFGVPAEAVGWRKQARIRSLTGAFIRAHRVRSADIRFDVASVIGDRVEIIEGAF